MPHGTTMEDHDQARAAFETESLQLRADLKTWESEWASAHGGRKPGRRDIKQNPDIGALSPSRPSRPPTPSSRLPSPSRPPFACQPG